MHVTVCIVGFRNAHDIQGCLEALARSTHTDFDVVICENGGPQAFEALRAILPPTLGDGRPVHAILAPGNLGYAGGVNACIALAPDSDAWWVLNPDTHPEPQAMALQVARLAAGDCEAVGSTIYLSDGRVQSHGGRWRPWLARAESIGHGSALDMVPDPADIERTQNYLNGASMMMSRRFLQTVGPMREEYFLYCEEVEWCLRGGKLGMRLGFAPGARVLHYAGTTTGSYDDMRRRPRAPIYLNERNKMLTTRDIFPARLPVASLASFTLIFLRFGRRGAWRQVGYGLSGWVAGMRNRRGAPAWFGL
ncbi:MAG: glycosyltransferase family 2 protein [Phenylobacterium sp.]|uniref:glycosyltransferase family 2 protein n=1 Tax=Phenylobacterium sp. TaxID=1871053 RepID=UPI0027327360|nr:glycosyltransferase family 2 protein [Phenylobacterium sp.]MDP3747236.1 glycosyltransferase family 2 protein [Phenylobacterium sp.]